jgi:hypothetical protein
MLTGRQLFTYFEFPLEPLRLRLHMEPYNDQTAARFKMKGNDFAFHE